MGIAATASAPGKLILCGEHAVVYGRPALALPLGDLRATVSVRPHAAAGLHFHAPDLGQEWTEAEQPENPLCLLAGETLAALGQPAEPLEITIRSTIPIASGMGSGAAVATALVRALAACFGQELSPALVSALVFANEQRLHGTPSGVDNTVIAFEQAIWFQRETATSAAPATSIEPFRIGAPLLLVIADTGVRSATKLPVGDVRRRWQAEPARYEAMFDQVAALVRAARAALAAGDSATLGPLLDQNHELLRSIGVSSPELDTLVTAARNAGSAGAKLSGAGWGGIMLALATPASEGRIGRALLDAGATRIFVANVSADG